MNWLRRVGLAIQRAARKAMRFAIGKCGCFTAATLVLTANGAVPIGDIEEGQQVFAAADDGLSGDYSSNTVGTKIIVGEASLVQLIVLHEDGSSEIINTTDEHPFHVADTAEWTRADGLRIGDELSTITGTAKLQGVIYTTERVPVYNLSIPGSPTYYVGEFGVWVHNAGPCDVSKKLLNSIKRVQELRRGTEIYKLPKLMRLHPHATPPGRWKKMKGWAKDGTEFHWYEHPKTGRVFGKFKGDHDPF